jgi:hypothetical protein
MHVYILKLLSQSLKNADGRVGWISVAEVITEIILYKLPAGTKRHPGVSI